MDFRLIVLFNTGKLCGHYAIIILVASAPYNHWQQKHTRGIGAALIYKKANCKVPVLIKGIPTIRHILELFSIILDQ